MATPRKYTDTQRQERADFDRVQVKLAPGDKTLYREFKRRYPAMHHQFLRECSQPVTELLHTYAERAKLAMPGLPL